MSLYNGLAVHREEDHDTSSQYQCFLPLKEAVGICILNGQLWSGLGVLDCSVFADLLISCTGKSHPERQTLIFISLAA